MFFLFDAGAIFLGGILGGCFQKRLKMKSLTALPIAIMLISIVGLFENIMSISGEQIVGESTVIVSIALVLGYAIGERLRLEDRIYSLSKAQTVGANGLIDAILFFGIGGLQISGPILYALNGDSFQLILKGMIDLPFALMLGATYGKRISLAAFFILAMQIIVALIAYCARQFIGKDLLAALCSLGYLILFFSGYNMLAPPKNKIKNINILPGMILIILYHVMKEILIK